eukprot:s1207_g1.t1
MFSSNTPKQRPTKVQRTGSKERALQVSEEGFNKVLAEEFPSKAPKYNFPSKGASKNKFQSKIPKQDRRLRHWAGSGDGLGRRWSPGAPRLFCVAGVALPSFCLAGVALGDICLRFVWQAWRSQRWAGSGGGLGRAGPLWRRATFAWQAWRLAICLRFVRQAWHGMALGDICLRFPWQAWRLVTSAFVLGGRSGASGAGQALVAALVGAGPLWRRESFAWQVWRLATFAFVLCGRRDTW